MMRLLYLLEKNSKLNLALYLMLEYDIENRKIDYYLEPPYESHYIIVRRDGFLIDGLRRACVLLYNGNTTVPVAILK